jgi:hypothetical protein
VGDPPGEEDEPHHEVRAAVSAAKSNLRSDVRDDRGRHDAIVELTVTFR